MSMGRPNEADAAPIRLSGLVRLGTTCLAIAVMGAISALAACNAELPSAMHAATPSPLTTEPTLLPSLATSSRTISWRPGSTPKDVVFSTAVSTANGYLAIGANPSALDSPSAWISKDGIDWSREPEAAFAATLGSIAMVSGLAAHGDSLVAVGAEVAPDQSRGHGAAWYSADGGHHWVRAVISGPADSMIASVTWGSSGWVAVGSNGFPGPSSDGSGAHSMASWRSSDGTHWEGNPTTAANMGGIPDLIDSGSGRYLASGRVLVGAPHPAAMWSSDDGRTWVAHPELGATRAHWVGAPQQTLVVGEADRAGAIWTSADGTQWSRATLEPSGLSDAALSTVGQVEGVWVALAIDTTQDTPHLVGWSSTDTQIWTGLDNAQIFAGVFAPKIVAGPTGLLLIGQVQAQNGNQGLGWVGAPTPP